MEEADSLGIFNTAEQSADANVYQDALRRIESEVAKLPKGQESKRVEGEEDEGLD